MTESSARRAAKDVFVEAIDLPDAEREEFVASACASPEIEKLVKALLAAHASAQGDAFLIESQDHVGRERHADKGTWIGPYRLERVLGEGGFGRVYLATQLRPVRRDVAIKIMKPGMDSAQFIARFEAERQALARMDHPGIARIFEAGTTDAQRPYFVMEYVRGESVTDYCDRRTLEIRDRIELFERVCLAVHHAHQKGVIHRDLKPGNILVTEHDDVALPKVIDFGIAKAISEPLTDRTLRTERWNFLGTPKYMSPEQARGGSDVDTRSDIYALGIVLYELLTGSTPFEAAMQTSNPVEIQRAICETPAPRPSISPRADDQAARERAALRRVDPTTLSRQLRGDLDWITLKALEKAPGRRYPSAAALALELRRYLEHEPVLARHPGRGYLVWKFVQRHQVAVTAAVAMLVTLIIGLVLAMLGMRDAQEQRDVVKSRMRDVYVAQAQALRSGTRPGRRRESLQALQLAAEIRPGADLRDEMIACLAVTDLARERVTPIGRDVFVAGPRRHDLTLSWSEPGTSRIVSVGTGRTVASLDGPKAPARRVWFSPKARYCVILEAGNRLGVWDLRQKRELFHLDAGRFRGFGVAFDRANAPSRWLVITEADSRVVVYRLPDASRWRELRLRRGGTLSLASSPSGAEIVAASGEPDVELCRWDITSGERRWAVLPSAALNSVSWSPDGRWIAGASSDTHVYVWQSATGRHERTLRGHQATAVQVEFCPAGDLLASYAWDNTTRLWNTARWEPFLGPLRGHRLTGFGARLMTWRGRSMSTWVVERAHELRRAHARSNFAAPARVAIRADGRVVATSGKNGLTVWSSPELEPLARADLDVARSVHFVGDNGLLVGSSDAVLLCSLHRGEGRLELRKERRFLGFRGLRATALSQDAKALVVVDADGAKVLDIERGKVVTRVPRYEGMGTTPSISRDGRWLFTGTWQGRFGAVWDLREGRMAKRFDGAHVVGAFRPDGATLCVGTAEKHVFYETGSWRILREHARSEGVDLAIAVAFSADCQTVAIPHSRYQTRLVDTKTAAVLATLRNPEGVATSMLCFDSTGSTLIAITAAKDLLAWDLGLIRSKLAATGLDW